MEDYENHGEADDYYDEFEDDDHDDDDEDEDNEYIPIDITDPFGLNVNNKNNNKNTTVTTTTTTSSTTATNSSFINSENRNLEDIKSYIIPSTANLNRTLEQLESDHVLLEQLHKKFSDQLYRLKLEESLLEEQKQNRK